MKLFELTTLIFTLFVILSIDLIICAPPTEPGKSGSKPEVVISVPSGPSRSKTSFTSRKGDSTLAHSKLPVNSMMVQTIAEECLKSKDINKIYNMKSINKAGIKFTSTPGQPFETLYNIDIKGDYKGKDVNCLISMKKTKNNNNINKNIEFRFYKP